MNTFFKVATLAASLAALAVAGGCARKKPKAGDDESSGSSTYGTQGGPSGSGAGGSVVGAPSETGAGGAMPSGRVVYFEFDSSELNQEGQQIVEAWGAYLAANASAKVRLEGHADERG